MILVGTAETSARTKPEMTTEDTHYPGYRDALQHIDAMTTEQLLTDVIDQLQGRKGVDVNDSEAVRREALRQFEIEWRSPEVREILGPDTSLKDVMDLKRGLRTVVERWLTSDASVHELLEDGVQVSASIGAVPENNGGVVRIGGVKRKKKKQKYK